MRLFLALILFVALRGSVPGAPGDDLLTKETLTVLTHNVLILNTSHDGAIRQILDADADVVCLQEVSNKTFPALREALQHRYPRFVSAPRGRRASVAVFAKEELTTRVVTETHWAGSVTVRGRQYHFLVVHLPSIGSSERSLKSMHAAYARSEKARLERIEQLLSDPRPEGPFLAVGDFNTLPMSPVWQRLQQEGLRDTALHDADGVQAAPTYPIRLDDRTRFGVRIDYVFASHELRPVETQVLDRMGSDHHAVLAVMEMGVPHPSGSQK